MAAKKLNDEDIEQIELILDIDYQDVAYAHIQQYLQKLYDIYKVNTNGS